MTRWYESGLRFSCTRCGSCCTGDPGHVWVAPDDEERIARHLGLDAAELARRYVRQVGERRSLVERGSGDCVFLTAERGCLIHPVKPRQCVTFPFWPRVIEKEEHWRRRAAHCPGMGHGAVWTADEIDALADPATPRTEWLRIASKPRS